MIEVKNSVPPDVRAAIAAFLNECQKEARPFAVEEALGAIRTIFPGMDISDADLKDAIMSEATTAGFAVDYARDSLPDSTKRKALDRWDNEGGASGRMGTSEAHRRIDNDTDGTRRRAQAMKDQGKLI
jgi:hypothetical protein